MGSVLIHAGMPKTGSTSIQRWISLNAERLRRDHGAQTLVAVRRQDPTGDFRLDPFVAGRVNSGPLIYQWEMRQRAPETATRFVDDLAVFADRWPSVLVTAEAFSQWFWMVDEPFLRRLEELARACTVRVAYYVRPQHEAIEALWREAGYRQSLEPSAYVADQAKRGLHYVETFKAVRRIAPHVDFDVRPFVKEHLVSGDVVCDFVSQFLEVDVGPRLEPSNLGLPLELVNALRRAPAGMFWNRGHETYPRRELRRLVDGLVIDESAKVRRGRVVLQQHCREVFEHGNKELMRELGWTMQDFVPPAEQLEHPWDIAELDDLWSSDATDAELAVVFRALCAALEQAAT